MVKYRIVHHVDKCIGCGACVALCPSNWVMEGAKSKPLKTEVDEPGCNEEAARVCPVKAIEVVKVE